MALGLDVVGCYRDRWAWLVSRQQAERELVDGGQRRATASQFNALHQSVQGFHMYLA